MFQRIKSLFKYPLLGASLTLFILLGHNKDVSIPSLFGNASAIASSPLSQTLLTVSPSDATQLLERGTELYDRQQFSDAAKLWQQAGLLFATQGDKLNQARVLSFLSLAYQQLGQWDEAEKVIKNSLNLLETETRTSKGNAPIFTQTLTALGHLQLAKGQPEDALRTWQQSEQIYTQLEDKTGITGSKINQVQAMQALGQFRQACKTLVLALKIEDQVCEPFIENNQLVPKQLDALESPTTLRSLGDILRLVGNLDNSTLVLEKSLKIAKLLKSNLDIRASLLSLANTERAIYNREKDLYNRTELPNDRKEAIKKAEKALKSYYELALEPVDAYTAKSTLLQAKLNRLSLLLEFEKWLQQNNKIDYIQNLWTEIKLKIASQTDELLKDPSQFSNLSPIQSIYARLNLVKSLSELHQNDRLSAAIQYAKDAYQQAKDLSNQRAEAYAEGMLGNLYEQTKEVSLAQSYTEEALRIAQSIQAWDIAYQWQYQLGRIYEKRGKTKDAIAAYDAAVNTLEQVRRDLLPIAPDLQFSFREDVKPIYRKSIELNLERGNLEKAIEVNGLLQLAELENFLRCGELDLIPLNKVKEQPAAVIYTVVLDNTIHVIVRSPQKPLHYHKVDAPLTEVEDTVKELRQSLEKNAYFDSVLDPAKKLYKWLIAPAKAALPKSGTLVFVLDTQLQKIPMAVLHDDKQYLVEKYSIALTLGSRLRKPKLLPPKQLRALVAGASRGKSFSTPPGFDPIPNVDNELDQLKKDRISVRELRNEEFTAQRFQTQFNTSDLPVIHLATHGLFSSDPERTFVLASDVPINIKQLDGLLRRRTQGSPNSIELLVLSACQTAEGDKRAALGIAGVAVQAGARSTLATLWQVNDRSAAELISLFYKALQQSGTTKADALQQAQVTLLKKYNPYYWAAFVLVGSWL